MTHDPVADTEKVHTHRFLVQHPHVVGGLVEVNDCVVPELLLGTQVFKHYAAGVGDLVVLAVVCLTSSNGVWDVCGRVAQSTDEIETNVQAALEHS